MRKVLLIVIATLVLGACGGDSDGGSNGGSNGDAGAGFGESSPGAPSPSPAFEIGTMTLGDDVEVRVQIAETELQRQIGLMGRTSLPDDAGMVFLFEEPSAGGFWMKDTLIPLSIAFIDEAGEIVDIFDMQPCKADPCDIYAPSAPYTSALEVNLGAFDEWGIERGTLTTLTR